VLRATSADNLKRQLVAAKGPGLVFGTIQK
jgi:hypothetical protein